MANDSNDTDRGKENDDLASLGPLSSPDTEDSRFFAEADTTEADLSSLASSSKANQNDQPKPLPVEDDSTIDLSEVVDTTGEETKPILETASEYVERRSDASQEQPTPESDTDVRPGLKSEHTDKSGSNAGRARWVLMVSIGFAFGIATASISIFIFLNIDRFRSNAPLSSPSTKTGSSQRPPIQPRVPQPLDLSKPNPATLESTQPEQEDTVTRPLGLSSKSRVSPKSAPYRVTGSIGKRTRSKIPIDRGEKKPSVTESASRPVSTSAKSKQRAPAKPVDRANAASAASSTNSPQSTEATDSNLDKIIDRVLDATEEDNINRSVARKESRKNAHQPPEQLPLAPSREQVTEAMAILLPAIRGCAKGLSGLATANIIVLSSGKVANVTVTGSPFAGTASGRCIEGVVRKARFPRFRQPSFRVRFPFSIRNVPK